MRCRVKPFEKVLNILENQLIAKRVAAVDDAKPGVESVFLYFGPFFGVTHFRKTLCILRIQNFESAFQRKKMTHVLDGYFPSTFKTFKHILEDFLFVRDPVDNIIAENNVVRLRADSWEV